jgi:hypothetical protein
MYKVYDSVGKVLKIFSTFKQANNFRITANRPDWAIIKE